MKPSDRTEVIEAWLAEGPLVAPDRVLVELPGRLPEAPQKRLSGLMRMSLVLAPLAAAMLLALVLTRIFAPPVGADRAPPIPSPPTPFGEGDRLIVVLLIENRSERPYGPWHWTGRDGSYWTAGPCRAIVEMFRINAPGVVRFGQAEPDEEMFARESLPVILDTDAMPGEPVAYSDSVAPIWTYAYRVLVSPEEVVSVEPLAAVPSVEMAGPLCPPPDTSWPGGWPDVQAWLRDRPALADCGVERRVLEPLGSEDLPNTAARRCFYDAWLAGEDGQFVRLVFTDYGPVLEVSRTFDGIVEEVVQDLRYDRGNEVRVRTCAALIPPSEQEGIDAGPEDDAAVVFILDAETCQR